MKKAITFLSAGVNKAKMILKGHCPAKFAVFRSKLGKTLN